MVITLTGENTWALRAELSTLVAGFTAEHGEVALERLDGEEASFERLQEALQSLPFLASKKLVVLRSPGANKQFTENAERLLSEVPEVTEVIVVEPKPDKRGSYYKLLKKTTDFQEFALPDARNMPQWLTKLASEQGGKLTLPDARFLVERVGANPQLLARELEKLLLYDPNVTRQTIELLTDETPQSKIFDLLDAAFAGNAKNVLKLYEQQRTLKVEPQQIIAMLAWQLHVLAVLKAAGDRSSQAIAGDAKISPYVVQKSQGTARKLSLAELKKLVKDLLTLDTRLKRESIDADEALKHYLLTLAIR